MVIEATSEEPDEVSQPEARQRPVRQIRPPVRYGVDEYVDTTSCTLKDQAHHAAYSVSQILEPMNMEEAMASDQAVERKQAADSEYESLISNETWELVELPACCTSIGCKWIFRIKYDSSGRVNRFKGCLVAKGHAQIEGIDYEETFSPVVRFSSIRTILAFALQYNMLIHQMDVVAAFLNGNLQEDIYMSLLRQMSKQLL